MTILVATDSEVLSIDREDGDLLHADDLGGLRPTCLALDPHVEGRAWCGTARDGVLVTRDGGSSWQAIGPDGVRVMSITASPAREGLLWVGAEPSTLWRSDDAGSTWRRTEGLDELPSSDEWAFPPRPDTHHVRWIASHPHEEGRLWLAIEAGALVSTPDGGETWRDRVEAGPYDTHELAIHPDRPELLRSAAGDGYYQSADGGSSWTKPRSGLDVGYLRSVAIDPGDPDVVVVSASSHAHSAYVAGRADGRLYRRGGDQPWTRVTTGWPRTPETIAPLVRAGATPGEMWAADDRGVHRSDDGGASWRRIAAYRRTPSHLRGLAT